MSTTSTCPTTRRSHTLPSPTTSPLARKARHKRGSVSTSVSAHPTLETTAPCSSCIKVRMASTILSLSLMSSGTLQMLPWACPLPCPTPISPRAPSLTLVVRQQPRLLPPPPRPTPINPLAPSPTLVVRQQPRLLPLREHLSLLHQLCNPSAHNLPPPLLLHRSRRE